jgi:hypothetical protein
MLVESACFELKSNFREGRTSPQQFDFMSAFSRPLNLNVTTIDRVEMIAAFSEEVTMPSWLTLTNVAIGNLPLTSISWLARLEYLIDDTDPAYLEEEVEKFCNHLLWALSCREERLGLRYFIANSSPTGD